MHYNTRTNTLIDTLPLDGYFEDGTLVQGLDLADAETQKLCGILPVTSDSPPQPEGTVEDETQRQITVGENGVDVVRVWVPAPPPPVPSSISPRQIRLWLVENGVSLATVAAAIDGIPDELLREKTKIEWEFSPYVERNHPMINTLGAALNLSPEQIDAAFVQAAQL